MKRKLQTTVIPSDKLVNVWLHVKFPAKMHSRAQSRLAVLPAGHWA